MTNLPHYKLKWWYTLEKEFQTAYLKALRNDKYIVYRRQDIGLGYKFVDSECWDLNWNCTQIEFKKIPGDTFNVSHFEQSQITLLHELDKRQPGIACVMIWSVKRNDYKILSFTEIWNWKNEKWGYKVFTD